MEYFGCGMTANLLKMDDFSETCWNHRGIGQKRKINEAKVWLNRNWVKQVKTASKPYLTLQPNNKAVSVVVNH